MFEMRHKFEIFIFLILVFIAFTTPTYWIQWTFLASIAFILLLIDLIFFDESNFIYDPNYRHWIELSQANDFQFEADYSSKESKKRQ